MRSGDKTPCMEILGRQKGAIFSSRKGRQDSAIIKAGEINDCTISGAITIAGRRTKSLLFSNVNIGDAELKIEGSYEKIAFVNCTFDKKSAVIISENDCSREVLIMGSDYHSPENEFLLIESDAGELDWKRDQLWFYDPIVTLEDMNLVQSYLEGEIKWDLDEAFDLYGADITNIIKSKSSLSKPELSWAVSLCSLGIAALVGMSKKPHIKKIKKEVKNEKKEFALVRA